MVERTVAQKRIGQFLVNLSLLFAFTSNPILTKALVDASCAGNTEICIYLPAIHHPALPVSVKVAYASNLRTGAYAIVGTLINITGKPVYGTNVLAKTYSQLNNPLDTLTGQTVFNATLPDQPNPFRLVGTQVAGGQVDHYDFDISGFSFVSNRIYVSPTVTFDPPIRQGGKVGVLRNTSAYTLTKVIMALLTPDVSPGGLMTSEVVVTLRPGQVMTVTRPIPPTEGPFVWSNAIFVAQGIAMP